MDVGVHTTTGMWCELQSDVANNFTGSTFKAIAWMIETLTANHNPSDFTRHNLQHVTHSSHMLEDRALGLHFHVKLSS